MNLLKYLPTEQNWPLNGRETSLLGTKEKKPSILLIFPIFYAPNVKTFSVHISITHDKKLNKTFKI